MTEELSMLVEDLKKQYRITDEDVNALKSAIDVTVQEAVAVVAGEDAGAHGEEETGFPYGEEE